jgi:hypothetical protein
MGHTFGLVFVVPHDAICTRLDLPQRCPQFHCRHRVKCAYLTRPLPTEVGANWGAKSMTSCRFRIRGFCCDGPVSAVRSLHKARPYGGGGAVAISSISSAAHGKSTEPVSHARGAAEYACSCAVQQSCEMGMTIQHALLQEPSIHVLGPQFTSSGYRSLGDEHSFMFALLLGHKPAAAL